MSINVLWFTARGAGLSALLCLSAAVVLGSLASRRSGSPSGRVVLQYVHRTAAVLGLLLVAVHVGTLLLDPKARVGVSGALIPFAAAYRPNAVALGSIAAYLLVLVGALGLARASLATTGLPPRVWRGLHALAYPMWVAAVSHGLLAGTDAGQRWVILLDVICVVAVLGALVVRVATLTEPGKVRPVRVPAGRGTR